MAMVLQNVTNWYNVAIVTSTTVQAFTMDLQSCSGVLCEIDVLSCWHLVSDLIAFRSNLYAITHVHFSA